MEEGWNLAWKGGKEPDPRMQKTEAKAGRLGFPIVRLVGEQGGDNRRERVQKECDGWITEEEAKSVERQTSEEKETESQEKSNEEVPKGR